jgi:hypothetical protein
MGVTMSPDAIVPALWTTTYIQAPLNGQGNGYYNIPSAYTAIGTVSSGTATLNLSTANLFSLTAAGNITVAFSNTAPSTYNGISNGQFWQVEIKSGGSYTIAWPASIIWDGGGASNTAPVLSLNTTVLNFYTRNGGTTVYGGYAFADLTI